MGKLIGHFSDARQLVGSRWIERRRAYKLAHVIGVKMRDQRVVERAGAGRKVALEIADDPGARGACRIGMRIGLGETISRSAGVHQQGGAVGKNEER